LKACDSFTSQAAPPVLASFTDEGESALRERFWTACPGIEPSERQKEVLRLHARYGYTCKEIEAMTGVPASTAGDWLALGRKRLAERINQDMKSLP